MNKESKTGLSWSPALSNSSIPHQLRAEKAAQLRAMKKESRAYTVGHSRPTCPAGQIPPKTGYELKAPGNSRQEKAAQLRAMKKESRAYTVGQIPPKIGYEIAFIGRSNVGKSCLMNSILNRKIAKVSQRPGCTLWLGIHKFHEATLIDLPGYGFVRTSTSRKELVNDLIIKYFNLYRTDMVFMLIDMRRGIMDIDRHILDMLNQYPVEIKLIGTKSDKKGTSVEGLDFCSSTHDNRGILEIQQHIICSSSSNVLDHLDGKTQTH